jgi:hypothetical protein
MQVCGKDIQVKGKLIRVASLAADMYEFLEDPRTAVEDLRNCNSRIDLFTFMQRLPETRPKYNYPIEWDNVAALQVSTFACWWTEQIDNKTRNMVRRAEKKDVKIREIAFDDELVRGISEIYNECEMRQGKPFAHYRKDFDAVRQQSGTFLSRSIFIGAFLDDKLIGFLKLILDETRTQAGLVHILSLIQHRDKAPNNALIAQAVRSCAERRIPYLVYSRFRDGQKQRDSLIEFKENNGFKRIDLPRYYIPLTRTGAVALRLGLHKRFADHVPRSVAVRLCELRNAWRKRKLQSLPEAS